MSAFLDLTFRGMSTASVYALAALGIMLIFKTSVLTNFAQGVIGMFNAFVVAYVAVEYGWSIWAAVVIGLITAIITGTLIDVLVIRRAKKVSPLSKQIITMGLVIVFLGVAPMFFGAFESRALMPKFFRGNIKVAGASLEYNLMFTFSLTLIIMIGIYLFLQKTRWGLAVRATASNPEMARMMGIPTTTVTWGAWVVAAILGTLAAVIFAPDFGPMSVGFMTAIQVAAFVACIFGGFQTIYGPVIAAYVLGMLTNWVEYFGDELISNFGSQWGSQLIYVSIIIFLLFRPNGLVGKKIVKKV